MTNLCGQVCGVSAFTIYNLKGFNLAMLTKQGWRLLSNPNALASQLFQDKYHSNGDFLNANLARHSPNYTWRSIQSSRELVAEGVQHKIGDGTKVSDWNVKWLRNIEVPKIETPIIDGREDIQVCYLMIPNNRAWDVELLEEYYTARDASGLLVFLCLVTVIRMCKFGLIRLMVYIMLNLAIILHG